MEEAKGTVNLQSMDVRCSSHIRLCIYTDPIKRYIIRIYVPVMLHYHLISLDISTFLLAQLLARLQRLEGRRSSHIRLCIHTCQSWATIRPGMWNPCEFSICLNHYTHKPQWSCRKLNCVLVLTLRCYELKYYWTPTECTFENLFLSVYYTIVCSTFPGLCTFIPFQIEPFDNTLYA